MDKDILNFNSQLSDEELLIKKLLMIIHKIHFYLEFLKLIVMKIS